MKKINSNSIMVLCIVSIFLVASSFKSFSHKEVINVSKSLLSKQGDCPITRVGRYSGGINAYTGSAPDGASYTCLNCHGGGAVTPTINMTVNPPFTNNTYVPGQIYTISYNVTGYVYFGFDFEINDGNTTSSTTAGTFSNPSANSVVFPTGTYPSNVSHSQRISPSNAATFTWTAPTNATNSLYLFSVGVGVNGNGNYGGDKMVSHNLILTPALTSVTEKYLPYSKIQIYPNPITDLINLQLNIKENTTIRIDILNIQGQKISSILNNTNITTGQQSLSMRLDHSFPKGIYFLQIKIGGNSIIKKIVLK